MAQKQSGVVSKNTGQNVTADEFNDLNIGTVNTNATDAESRLSTLEAAVGLAVPVTTSLSTFTPTSSETIIFCNTSNNKDC